MTSKKVNSPGKRDICSTYSRDFNISKRAVDVEKRTVELAFSSEEPYERWFGIEILDHDTKSVNLDRLRNGGAVLVDHDTKNHVGVVERVEISDDRVGRAVVRFGRGRLADEIFNDVDDGIRQLVSVGYAVDKYELETKGEKGEPDTYRMTHWTPHEISIVSVPADATVGVGRSHDDVGETINSNEETKMSDKDEAKKPETPAINLDAERDKARKSEQERIRKITILADQHDCSEKGREFIEGNRSYADFQSEVLKVIGERNVEARAKADPDKDESLGLTDKEKRRYSLFRAMSAIANPNDMNAQRAAAFELEVSAAGAERVGITPRGLFVPTDIQERDLSAGTATDGAELVATNLLAGSFIDVLRNNTVIGQAGATILPGLVGNVDIPRKTSGAAAAWIAAEDGDAANSDPQFDQVSLTPKDVACYTQATRRLLQQSSLSVENLIRDDLAQAAALAIDLAGLYGSGASGQPTGVVNQTSINTFNLAAADPTYAETIRMVKEVMTDNALMGSLSYIIDPNGWEALSTTSKDTGSGMFLISENNTINGYPYQVSSQVTAEDYFFGNFRDLLVGMWGGLEINVDPYTHSLKGKTRYVMFQTVDVAVRHPESFCFSNDGV